MFDPPLDVGAESATAVDWCDEARNLHCRVCDWEGEGTLIAKVTALAQHDLPLVRCPECLSIDILELPLDSSPTDASVDGYVEAGAGISTIAEALVLVDPARVKRFLDVGCNYGFALDVGRKLFHWEVLGVEPSLSGTRGAAELALDIRNEYLTDRSDIGDNFDLILASEVVEHVPRPLEFLDALRKRSAPNGTVVLTTPAAEIISRESPLADVLGAVSAGYHVFVASERGLEILLLRAGFTSVRIVRRRENLTAVARRDTRAQKVTSNRRPVPRLHDYYLDRATSAEPGSPLSLGMAVRYLRATVATGEFGAAVTCLPLVFDAFRATYDLNLADPASVALPAEGEGLTPWSLAGAAFALGMIDLLHTNQPQRAAEYFDLAARSASSWRRAAGVADLDTIDLLFQAPYHRLLALAKFDGATATEEAGSLGSDHYFADPESMRRTRLHQCRAFVDIVAHGTYLPDSALADLVARAAPEFASSQDSAVRATGLDTFYSLGIANLNLGRTRQGVTWLQNCQELCSSRNYRNPHSRRLARQCGRALSTVPPRVESMSPPGPQHPLHHYIDVYWCDAYGTYLEGWAHLKSESIDRLTVHIGDRFVEASRKDRPDLLSFWPEHPKVTRGGFSAYLAGRPGGTVRLVADTPLGRVEQVVDLPDHPLPVHPEFPTSSEWDAINREWLDMAPPGPLLALGVRSSTKAGHAFQISKFGGREVIGFDIHPGIGVDVVGDAHHLTKYFPANHFAAVWSGSFLEHVTTPWLVAAESVRVLQVGGVALHGTPWVWPTHAAPQDFWRFSSDGLQQLFDARLGLEIISSGSVAPAVVLPSPSWRTSVLSMPTTTSASLSWIAVQKVNERVNDVVWPYDGRTNRSSPGRYPVDGLSQGPTE